MLAANVMPPIAQPETRGVFIESYCAIQSLLSPT